MSEIDLKAYLFGELPEAERRAVAAHLEQNAEARAEYARLEATQAMLGMVRDEELPRRIAFVSDKVFEPTWWQRFWASTPQLGFASAALLALAIVGHGWLSRPVAVNAPAVAKVDAAVIREVVAAEMRKQPSAMTAVPVAVTGSDEERTAKMIAAAIKEAERKAEMERATDRLTIEENFNLLRRLISRDQMASYQQPRTGER